MGQADLLCTAHIGALTVDEAQNTFNLGVSPKDTPNLVRWVSESPVNSETAESNDYRVVGTRGDRIIVEVRNGDNLLKRAVVDTATEWPAEASGGNSVSTSLIFT